MQETDMLVENFANNFSEFRESGLVIYGLGALTKTVLEAYPDFNIIGLMDEARTGDIVFGKPVISIEQAVRDCVKAIVIIARIANVKIIYRRIEDDCRKYNIAVYDISGNRLDKKIEGTKSFAKYKGLNEIETKKRIDEADVVSFDIFDTLIMRRVLYPRDVFELVGQRHDLGADFVKRRIGAESKYYTEGKQPTIYDIYDKLGSISPEAEIEIEIELCVKRNKVVSLLEYAQKCGKQIFLVSEMYLPKEILHRILSKLGVNVPIDNIIVSCDYGVSKTNGLFEHLRNRVNNKKILHIGDNIEADIQNAKRFGIDDTYHIYSALEMLEDYSADMLKHANTLVNRIVIGEFIAIALNNPYIFASEGYKLKIASGYELGYAFLSPLVLKLFAWVIAKAKELNLDTVLLASRDGYLLERLYRYHKDKYNVTPMQYFYTSRAVSVIAGLQNDEDIVHAANLAFAGRPQEMLVKRFGIGFEDILTMGDEEEFNHYIKRHRNKILEIAEKVRKRYLVYIKGLNIRDGARVGFFDFVSAGTCQKALVNICEFDLYGLYCAGINYENHYKSDTYIEAMFGVAEPFKDSYHFLSDYFFMENVMSSFEATLSGFTENGEPLFLQETRQQETISEIEDIHRGIIDYAKSTTMSLEQLNDISLDLIDEIFNCVSDIDCFAKEQLNDEFCNRTIN